MYLVFINILEYSNRRGFTKDLTYHIDILPLLKTKTKLLKELEMTTQISLGINCAKPVHNLLKTFI